MKIAIVTINYCPELTGIAVYSTGMAEHLAAAGHRVTVHTGFPYYPAWQKRPEDRTRWFAREQVEGVHLRRCYLYVPGHPSAIKRMLHEFSFTVSASLSYLMAPRADLTVIVSPPLPLGVPIALLARLKRSRTICHVQDLQPDAAVDLGMLRPGLLTQALFALERLTYRLVDRVSTISEAMRKRIESKGVPVHKSFLFKNWADNQLISVMEWHESLRSEWLLQDRFVVLYAGNLGVKQGLDALLDVARHLSAEQETIFLIVGEGGEKSNLVARAVRDGLENVRFMAPVSRADLSRLLATADVSVIPQKPNFKDVVLPSKLGNILLSQRAVIVAASDGTELADIVRSAQCGIVVAAGDTAAMASAILELRDDPPRRAEMAARGRAFAMEHLTRSAVLRGFMDAALAETSSPRFDP